MAKSHRSDRSPPAGRDSSASGSTATNAPQSSRSNSELAQCMQPRTVAGGGGYVYQQFPDGTIAIVEGPSGVGTKLRKGRAWEAITQEIGAFPPPAEFAEAPTVARPPLPEGARSSALPDGGMSSPLPDSGMSVPEAPSWIESLAAQVEERVEDTKTALDEAADAAGSAIEKGWNWLFGDDEPPAEIKKRVSAAPEGSGTGPEQELEAPKEGAREEGPAPEELTPEKSIAPEVSTPPEKGSDKTDPLARVAYKSQRDNNFDERGVFDKKGGKISGDNMCNITTLAMQLKTLAQDEQALQSAAADLLLAKGYSGSKEKLMAMQLEDVLMTIFKQLGEAYFENNCRGYKPNARFGPHQYRICLQHVAGMFPQFVSGAKSLTGGTDRKKCLEKDPKAFYEDEVGPYHDSGAAVMLSTRLTGGHIVLLADVRGDGLLINDPYGMRLSAGYVKNGDRVAAKKRRITRDADVYERRLQHHPRLKSEVDGLLEERKATLPQNMGQLNFYGWDEVKKYAIGKWVNVLEQRK